MVDQNPRSGRISFFNVILWCAALAILIFNAVLLRQNQRLKLGLIGGEISEGRPLRHLAALAVDGKQQPILVPTRSQTKLLVITFSPGCEVCKAAQPGWDKLTQELRARGWRIAWVSRDPLDVTTGYCREKGIPLIEVYADPPFRTYAQLDLRAVPNTIIVSSDGVVEKVFPGNIDEAGVQRIFAYLGIKAPTKAGTVPERPLDAAAASQCCEIPAKDK